MAADILILNGSNLNLLGEREPDIYGHDTLADIEAMCQKKAKDLGVTIDFKQSNHEGELVEWIHAARKDNKAIVINGAGYSHTSASIHDALAAFDGPIMEVHMSNVYKREAWRHNSFIARIATGVFCGVGSHTYTLALEAATILINKK